MSWHVWMPKVLTITTTYRGVCNRQRLYFSAHWCPPCRGFTPALKQTPGCRCDIIQLMKGDLTIDGPTSRWEPVFVADDVPVFHFDGTEPCWRFHQDSTTWWRRKVRIWRLSLSPLTSRPQSSRCPKRERGWLVVASFYWWSLCPIVNNKATKTCSFLLSNSQRAYIIQILHVAKLNLACLPWYRLSCC